MLCVSLNNTSSKLKLSAPFCVFFSSPFHMWDQSWLQLALINSLTWPYTHKSLSYTHTHTPAHPICAYTHTLCSLHLTTFCLQYKPTVIACVCIHLACKWSNWEIPVSTDGKHWWEYVDSSVTLELLDGELKLVLTLS